MPPPNDDPLKLRTFKLSDATYDAIGAIADAMTIEKGIRVSRADVVRMLVIEETKRRAKAEIRKSGK